MKFSETDITEETLRSRSNVELHMLMSKFYCSTSFALDSAHVKFDVWPGPLSDSYGNGITDFVLD